MWMYVIDLIEGKVSEEDRKLMREALLKITRGETRLYGIKKLSDNDGNRDNKKDKQVKETDNQRLAVYHYPPSS